MLVYRWHLKSWSRTRQHVESGERDPRTEPSHYRVNRLGDQEKAAKETKKSGQVNQMFQKEGSDQICPVLLMGEER